MANGDAAPGAMGRGSAAGRDPSLESIWGLQQEEAQWQETTFPLPNGETLQDTWRKQPDIINVKIQLGAQGAARISSELEVDTPCMEEPGC